ncbi:MAG: hypothetical protein AAF614_41485 [Chloroflexota bacterium]
MDKDDNLAPTDNDFEMLSLIIDDALAGVDVAARYPTFYRKIQAIADLRAAYEDALAILERDADGTLDPLPQPPSRDLSFLHTAVLRPTLSRPQTNRLQAYWKQTAEAIQALFAPPPRPQVVYRSADYLADPQKTLMRGGWQHEGRDWSLVLHATQPADHPGQLSLTLWLSSLEEPSPDAPPSRWRRGSLPVPPTAGCARVGWKRPLSRPASPSRPSKMTAGWPPATGNTTPSPGRAATSKSAPTP